VRRVVGLTPWGEQILLRVKHHALSAYDPTSAGLHCPHQTCQKDARLDLHHIFWTCPAARRLSEMLIKRWRSAGLKMDDYEAAFFSLSLQGMPHEVTATTGQVIAACMDSQIGELGGGFERVVAQC
jgi:hypothetical protein